MSSPGSKTCSRRLTCAGGITRRSGLGRAMSISSFVRLSALLIASVAAISAAAPPRVFGPSQVQEVYRVLLDRDSLLLESITDVIKQKGINDGQVLITAGSVQECTYHFVTSTAAKPKDEYKTVRGPFEILNAGGIIANGEPHIH